MRNGVRLGWLLACLLVFVAPLCADASEVCSEPLTIRFVDVDDFGGALLVAHHDGFVHIDGRSLTTLEAVADPDSYVELFVDGANVAGGWCDEWGCTTLLMFEAPSPTAELRFVQKDGPSPAVAIGSLHCLSRPGTQASNPAAVRHDNLLTIAYAIEGGGCMKTWNLDSEHLGTSEYSCTNDGLTNPRPVVGSGGTFVRMFASIGSQAQYNLYSLDPQTQIAQYVAGPQSSPHIVAADSDPSGFTVYYTKNDRVVAHCSNYNGTYTASTCRWAGEPDDLSAVYGPDTYRWLATGNDGLIRLYRESVLKDEFCGTHPALSRVCLAEQESVCLLYLSPGDSGLYVRCFQAGGASRGPARCLLEMPDDANNIDAVAYEGSHVLLFWDQEFLGESHVFFTMAQILV